MAALTYSPSTMQEVQMDNPVTGAHQQVVLVMPRPAPVWPAFHSALTTVAATVGGSKHTTAAMFRLAVWRRRPGGEIVSHVAVLILFGPFLPDAHSATV
jgi:hypothetical protein